MLLCGKPKPTKKSCPCRSKHKKTWDGTAEACSSHEGFRMCPSAAVADRQYKDMLSNDLTGNLKTQASKCLRTKFRSDFAKKLHTEETPEKKRKTKRYVFCCKEEDAGPTFNDPWKCSQNVDGVEFRLYADGPDKGCKAKKKKGLDLCSAKSKGENVAADWCARQGGRLCDHETEVAPLTALVKKAIECDDACAAEDPSFDRDGLRCLQGAYRTRVKGAETRKKPHLYVHHAGTANMAQKKHLLCCFGEPAKTASGSKKTAAENVQPEKSAPKKPAEPPQRANKAATESQPAAFDEKEAQAVRADLKKARAQLNGLIARMNAVLE